MYIYIYLSISLSIYIYIRSDHQQEHQKELWERQAVKIHVHEAAEQDLALQQIGLKPVCELDLIFGWYAGLGERA